MLSKSMRKYATENVLSQYVQWVGNNSTRATESTYELQRAIVLVVDKVTVPPSPRGWTGGGGLDKGRGGRVQEGGFEDSIRKNAIGPGKVVMTHLNKALKVNQIVPQRGGGARSA